MERMVLKYHEKASKNGVLVVSACGFDSIPADLGVAFILREFKEKNVTAVNIKSILEVQSGPKGMAIHYATYESAVHGVGSIEDLKTIRKELSSKSGKFKPSTIGKPLKLSILPEFDPAVSKWIIPFPGADASVVKLIDVMII